MKHFVLIAMAVSALLITLGCGDDDGGSESVQVVASEYSYDLPAQVKGGVVTFEINNEGDQIHEFAFGRIDEGKTIDDLKARFETEGGEEADWAHDLGGIPGLSPGMSLRMTRELEDEGTYFFVCFFPSPEGEPHINLGMIKSFEISGDSGAELPKPDAVIEAGGDEFVVPDLKVGRQILEFKNTANEPREFQIISPEPGKTEEEIGEWFDSGLQGNPPVVFPGGMQTIPAGTSVFIEMELEKGRTYLLTSETEDGGEISAEFTPS